MSALWSHLFVPGLLQSPPVVTALWIGAVVAVSSSVVGVFVVLRGQAFLGHALGDMGSTGGAAAGLAGVGALWGFLAAGLVAGSAVDLGSGGHGARERDVMTGIALAATVGLSALFLYLLTQVSSEAGATQTILFGSIFAASPSLLPIMAALSAFTVALVALVARPLLFATVAPQTAEARSVPVRLVGYLFLLAVVTAVEQSALVVGALLSTALLIGPAAAAVQVTRTLAGAMTLGIVLSLAVVVLGIVLAYDSFTWPPGSVGWPVSFFVCALTLLVYLAARLIGRRSRHRQGEKGARAA
jgi:zinc/manganese transport system permease protein